MKIKKKNSENYRHFSLAFKPYSGEVQKCPKKCTIETETRLNAQNETESIFAEAGKRKQTKSDIR